MKLYDAAVRLAGQITNEVNVYQVTAAEIAVLHRIHGGADAVQRVVEVGSVRNRSDARERARLAALYPKGMGADGKQPLEGAAFINSIFGVGTPLPSEYVAPVIEESEEIIDNAAQQEQEEIEIAVKPVPIKATVLRKKKEEVALEAAELTA